MTLSDLQSQESNLRDMMLLTYDNQEVYLGLLRDYEQCIRNSFAVDPDWHLLLACEIQEQLDELEKQLFTISDEEFDNYSCLWDIVAILLE